MELGVETGGEGCIHHNPGLGIPALEHHGIAHHTDVRHQTHQFNPVGPLRQNGQDCRVSAVNAKSWFVDAFGAAIGQGLGGLPVQSPAVASLHTVLHRQELPFPGLQIVLLVGVPGEDDMAGGIAPDFLRNPLIQLLRPREAQGPVYEVVLIVDDEQVLFHGGAS